MAEMRSPADTESVARARFRFRLRIWRRPALAFASGVWKPQKYELFRPRSRSVVILAEKCRPAGSSPQFHWKKGPTDLVSTRSRSSLADRFVYPDDSLRRGTAFQRVRTIASSCLFIFSDHSPKSPLSTSLGRIPRGHRFNRIGGQRALTSDRHRRSRRLAVGRRH